MIKNSPGEAINFFFHLNLSSNFSCGIDVGLVVSASVETSSPLFSNYPETTLRHRSMGSALVP